MQIKKRTTFALASSLGLVLALAASSGVASAMAYYENDDDSGIKNQACAAIGCPNGNRECAKASGTVKAGVAPWVGEIQVTYTCYESPFF